MLKMHVFLGGCIILPTSLYLCTVMENLVAPVFLEFIPQILEVLCLCVCFGYSSNSSSLASL